MLAARRGRLCAVLMLGAIVASHSRGGSLGLVAMLGVLAAVLCGNAGRGSSFGGLIAVSLRRAVAPGELLASYRQHHRRVKDDTGSREARRRCSASRFRRSREPAHRRRRRPVQELEPAGTRSSLAREPQRAAAGRGGARHRRPGCVAVSDCAWSVVRARVAATPASGSAETDPRPRSRGRGGQSAAAWAATLASRRRCSSTRHSAAMAAALAGWFVCALFASVAYNWTFYYLLALAAAPRDILRGAPRRGARFHAARRAAAQRAIGGCQGMMRRAARPRTRGPAAHRFVDVPARRTPPHPGRRAHAGELHAWSRRSIALCGPTLVSSSSSRPAKNRTGSARSTARRGDVRPDHAGARGADEVRRLRRVRLHVGVTPARHLPHPDVPRRRRQVRLRRAGQVDARLASTVLRQRAPAAQLHRGRRDRPRQPGDPPGRHAEGRLPRQRQPATRRGAAVARSRSGAVRRCSTRRPGRRPRRSTRWALDLVARSCSGRST